MYSGLDEHTLAVLCSQRDSHAEDELYRRYAARLLTLCRRYTSDVEEACDLMHDSFIRALERIDSFKYLRSGSLYAWMSRIAVNAALNYVKRYKFRFIYGRLPDTLEEPSEDDVRLIPQEIVIGFISSLPETQRIVFNMYCIDGYSHKEIAEMLGISEKGSSGLLAKARIRLKKMINEYLKYSE